jgi:hypothetical protein
MMSFKRGLVGATVGLALASGIVGTTAGSAAAEGRPGPAPEPVLTQIGEWCIAADYELRGQGTCDEDPRYDPDLHSPLNMGDKISSIRTNSFAIQTWNDRNYTGTYGYFAPWYYWSVLNAPYNDSISSMRTIV